MFLLFGLSKCNDLAVWWPGWQASRVRAAITTGGDWPSALVAADRRLPRGNMLSAKCSLAQGRFVSIGRFTSRYIIHGCTDPDRDCDLKSGITMYATVGEWEMGLRDQLLKPGLCRSVVVSINRDYDVNLELDSQGTVKSVSRAERRE